MKRRSYGKKISKNKSIKKNTQLQIAPINYYSKHYKNTELIPKTDIINYIFSGYSEFLIQQNLSDSLGVYSLDLEQCFIIEPNAMPSGLRSDNINLSLKMNPETPLNKLIAYSFYLKQPYIFEKEDGLKDIKYQIGKDIKRSERKINGKLYDGEYYRNYDNNYLATDVFYQNIIDKLFKLNYKYVNLNIANKFALLSCQNVFNLITDLITLKLNQILEPETNSVFRPDKFANIIINRNEISMELGFESDLIISRDGEPMDPEYPCGRLEFILYIDMIRNTYELKKFILNYNIDKCGPEIVKKDDKNEENDKFKSNFKPEYVIPAGILTAGIAATPILLATLGGKKKSIRKTRRRIKHK